MKLYSMVKKWLHCTIDYYNNKVQPWLYLIIVACLVNELKACSYCSYVLCADLQQEQGPFSR